MRVLIAVDASDHGVMVAQTAHALFGADAEFLVVSVTPLQPAVGWSMGWGAASPLTSSLAESAGEVPTTTLFALLAQDAGRHAAEVFIRSPLDSAESIGDVGEPTSCILSCAHEHHVDVVVVGFHDRSWFSRLLAPSVSRGVLRCSHIPVLVVR